MDGPMVVQSFEKGYRRLRKIPRRDVLKFGGTLAFASAATPLLVACESGETPPTNSGDKVWRQFSGTTINFISENTSPSSAIAANLKPFTGLTGIHLNIQQMELQAMVQTVALDLASGNGKYHVIYADPYQVLAPFYQGLADLNQFIHDRSLPAVPKGIQDFIPTQLAAAGRFVDANTLYCLPYDCPTLIWAYRKDLFEKYGRQMQQDLGFDPMPSDNSTWEQYYQIANWFNKHATADVPYGTGHQAKQHDSLMCDFSNVLWAYGGHYFNNDEQIGTIGTMHPGPCLLDRPEAIQAAEFYQKLLKIAHPGSTSWDWNDLAEAFTDGQVAMCPEWHEDASGFEMGKYAGKIGYARLPKGPARSANMYGGTGIGINKSIPLELQKAAWLFVVWGTSPDAELIDLKSKVGGGTPTRQSVYELPEVKKAMNPPSKMPNLLTAQAVFKAWEPHNIGLRPKIPSWNECDTIIYTELSKMLVLGKSPADAMRSAKQAIDKATGEA
jgi:multiple sugar transport system substrate-binding protein